MLVRTVHRWSALLIIIFLIAHIGNHLIALGGVAAHISAMENLRLIYRYPVVEGVLLIAFAVQITTGVTRVVAGWRKRSGGVAWLQAGTGLYIATFLLIHVGAVLTARSDGVNTNFHFAAAGMHVEGFVWFFTPYYSLAVASLFTHIGCALYWAKLDRGQPVAARRRLQAMAAMGIATGATIVATLAGWIVPVIIPASYLSAFSS